MQNAAAHSNIDWRFIRAVRESFVPIPDYRSFTRTLVDNDESKLGVRPLNCLGELEIDPIRADVEVLVHHRRGDVIVRIDDDGVAMQFGSARPQRGVIGYAGLRSRRFL